VSSAAAPVRLDFAGGWTDVPPYSAREGGVVVSAAIALHARAEVLPRQAGYRLVSGDLGTELDLAGTGELATAEPLPLLRAGLRMLPVGPCTLSTRSDAPPGSGLGTSGALDVAIVAALSAARGESPGVRGIADLACRLEAVEAGIAGGRQDQFTAAYGGVLRLEFRDPAATVEPLALDRDFLDDLARRPVLCHRRLPLTITRVMRSYEWRGCRPRSLDRIRGVADAGRGATRKRRRAAGLAAHRELAAQQAPMPACARPI
jgi:D-glycero-alpha-D-manno-heptose-7-phosphate kinase